MGMYFYEKFFAEFNFVVHFHSIKLSKLLNETSFFTSIMMRGNIDFNLLAVKNRNFVKSRSFDL